MIDKNNAQQEYIDALGKYADSLGEAKKELDSQKCYDIMLMAIGGILAVCGLCLMLF